MKVQIDKKSGFCFGVVYAINKAEQALESKKSLNCLGDIVHNSEEVKRLKKKGLGTIDHAEMAGLNNTAVLLRAHGEPPATYELAAKNNITIIDATCPVVLNLQKRIKQAYGKMKECKGQVVIYGKRGHAEVNGLVGQTEGTAIVVTCEDDLSAIDFTRPVSLFSQTTQDINKYKEIKKQVEQRLEETGFAFEWKDTICRQVSNREDELRVFAKSYSVIVFVSGRKSSNGKFLYSICKEENQSTYFVSNENEIEDSWFEDCESVGVCGATSTPSWLMEKVADCIEKKY